MKNTYEDGINYFHNYSFLNPNLSLCENNNLNENENGNYCSFIKNQFIDDISNNDNNKVTIEVIITYENEKQSKSSCVIRKIAVFEITNERNDVLKNDLYIKSFTSKDNNKNIGEVLVINHSDINTNTMEDGIQTQSSNTNDTTNKSINSRKKTTYYFNKINLNVELKHIIDSFIGDINDEFNNLKDRKINECNIESLFFTSIIFKNYTLMKELINYIFNRIKDTNIIHIIRIFLYINEDNTLKERYLSILCDLMNRNLENDYIYCWDNQIKYCYWLVQCTICHIIGLKQIDSNAFDIYFDLNSSNEKSNFVNNKITKNIANIGNISNIYLSYELKKDILIYKKNHDYAKIEQSEFSYDVNKSYLSCSLRFLNGYGKLFKKSISYYYQSNNYFNTGKVFRIKNTTGIINDYPHYYQMVLDNFPELQLFAIRESENSNFILSTNQHNFNKMTESYLAEIEANFWGTQFDIYDNGYNPYNIKEFSREVTDERILLGKVIYDTNIMGECPRYFKSELYNKKSNGKVETFLLKNLEPEWNVKLNCYCLNFYGRVKKASSRNFQMVFNHDKDEILLQHGKENSNEFNIDFKEPFNFITAFAHSLVSIGRKRVVQ